MDKTEGQLISESLEREDAFFRKASKGHTVNPFEPSLPDEEDLSE